jgi:hypothetical protein
VASACQAFLAVIFAVAAWAKLERRDDFVRTLVSLPWLSVALARRLALVIPVVELAVAALVVALPKIGAASALALLVVFSAVIATELVAGRAFRCGCFGGASTGTRSAGKSALARNCVLGAAATVLLVVPSSVSPGAILFGIGVGLSFLLLEVAGETLLAARAR